MAIKTEELKKIILKSGFVKDKDFDDALRIAHELDRDIRDVLIFKGYISEDSLGQIIAEYYQVPFASIKNRLIPSEVLSLIPEKIAQTYRLIPFAKTDKGLSLAMTDPKDFEALEIVKRKTGLKINIYYITQNDLSRSLSQYKRNIKAEFAKIIAENVKKAERSGQDIAKAAEELPVIRILDTLMEYAMAERASDVHIETTVHDVLIRFRIDGILQDITTLPKAIQPAIVARIKILSDLKIDEHRIPQDGRYKFAVDEDFVAVRVSIIPGFYGENVVMRLLPETARPLSLEELGLADKSLKLVHTNITKPHGMILVTGPTGSGKTTTLYSILTILNTAKVKICTIEDPIEYGIARVNQIQVNTQTGLTFATGLRSLLRHDPDIIMVGEIRDHDTAEIAIHSALTGHLVLSTLHTNDAPSTIPRFLDMGAEGYLVASTVNVILAQRLVRTICKSCLEKIDIESAVLNFLAQQVGDQVKRQEFYHGQGCPECNFTGYKGRIAIFEVLDVTDDIRHLTIKKVSVDEIKATAVKQGMITMLEDGLNKVAAGLTTVEEVLRAVRE